MNRGLIAARGKLTFSPESILPPLHFGTTAQLKTPQSAVTPKATTISTASLPQPQVKTPRSVVASKASTTSTAIHPSQSTKRHSLSSCQKSLPLLRAYLSHSTKHHGLSSCQKPQVPLLRAYPSHSSKPPVVAPNATISISSYLPRAYPSHCSRQVSINQSISGWGFGHLFFL